MAPRSTWPRRPRPWPATTAPANSTPGGWLFSEWYVAAPTSNFWAVPFDASHPLTTPSGLDTKDPAVLQALANAVLSLRAHHVPLDASYGQVQFYPDGAVKIPVPGCSTGCLTSSREPTASVVPSTLSRTARPTTALRSS